tara:strand:- start:39 stop:746 length:708 start_codon:yes stop_codon:yes gene_type:complete
MSKISLTLSLDETFVRRDEVNTLFNNFLVKINTTKLDFDQFRYKTIRYRHLSKPPVKFLWDEKVGAAIGGALPGGGAWLTTPCEILNVVHTAGYDPGPGGLAAVYVEYEATDWEDSAYEIAVGYRHSGTWYSLEGTERTFGFKHTNDQGVAYSGTTSHYYTGAAGWKPEGAQNQPVITSCGLVSPTHIRAGHSMQNIDRYALLLRMNAGALHAGGTKTIDAWDRARIWAIVKDST